MSLLRRDSRIIVSMRARIGLVGSGLLLAVGCRGEGGSGGNLRVRFDVGGAVVAQAVPDVGLPGVTISLIDVDAEAHLATTSTAGLWSVSNLEPGPYAERYEIEGYEPVSGIFSLDAFGENDVSNPFVSRPTVLMQETLMRASVEPFSAELLDGSDLFDGIGGVAATLDLSAGEDLVVNLSLPLFGSGYVVVEDASSSDFTFAVLDSATLATFSLSAAAIAAMNGGTGLTGDSNPQTRHTLHVSGDAVTPIHGTAVSFAAELHFNAIP